MQTLNEVLNNKVLIIPFLVLIITQVCKTIYFSIKNKTRVDFYTLILCYFILVISKVKLVNLLILLHATPEVFN